MNKLQTAMLNFFSTIDVDKNSSTYSNYSLFTNSPVSEEIFKYTTEHDEDLFEKLFRYKIYSIFEIREPLKIILKLKKLNVDELAYLAFEQYLMVTTMYKNDEYLFKLYNFYTLALTDKRLLDIVKNIKIIDKIPNFVHPYNYVFVFADKDAFDINKLQKISKIIDEQYCGKWSRGYSLIKCSVEIKEVKNMVVKLDNTHWLMKNNGIFFPTTDTKTFNKYHKQRRCKFGSHSFEYLLDDLKLSDSFNLFEIVNKLKNINDIRITQKYISLINYLRVVRNYKDIEFVFSDTCALIIGGVRDTPSQKISKNNVVIVDKQEDEKEQIYLISPCANIKGTYYMQF